MGRRTVAEVKPGVVGTLQERGFVSRTVEPTQPVRSAETADGGQLVVVVCHPVLVVHAPTHYVRVGVVPVAATDPALHSIVGHHHLTFVIVTSRLHRERVLI